MKKNLVHLRNGSFLLKKVLQVNRRYKDELFRIVFQNKQDLLQLYNAINNTNYTNENDLQIYTLEDAILIGVKNDLSFILSQTLNLYEQQSSINPNMPLRGLIYFAELFSAYIQQQKLHIYGSKLIKLPLPQYVVFYNGTAKQPDILEMKLSDAYEIPDKEGCLECKAIMININLGHNKDLLDSCKKLKEYAQFVDKIRDFLGRGLETNVAISEAINECIDSDILADILEKNRAEIMNILSKEYYEKYYWKLEREAIDTEAREAGLQEGRKAGLQEGRQEGRQEGHREGLQEGLHLGIVALIEDNLEEGVNPERIVEKLVKKFELDNDKAKWYVENFFNSL